MINNAAQIRELLSFNKDTEFYFVQLLSRRKDNPDQTTGVLHIKSYYISSLEHFDKLLPEIIKISDATNSRAYINLNKRCNSKIGLEIITKTAELLKNGQYNKLKNVYDIIVGESSHDEDKKWLIDVDEHERTFIDNLTKKLVDVQVFAKKEPLCVEIPTKNGVHLITRAFNPKKILDVYPDLDIHKNNPTILYIP